MSNEYAVMPILWKKLPLIFRVSQREANLSRFRDTKPPGALSTQDTPGKKWTLLQPATPDENTGSNIQIGAGFSLGPTDFTPSRALRKNETQIIEITRNSQGCRPFHSHNRDRPECDICETALLCGPSFVSRSGNQSPSISINYPTHIFVTVPFQAFRRSASK
jgi:hypothetical protein